MEMTRFLLVYLVPLIPLLVVGVVLKDKQISRNKIVAYGAKLAGPSATYMAFAFLALTAWPATGEVSKFTVQLKGSEDHIQKISAKGTIVKLWTGHDYPVVAEIVPTTPRSVDLAFRVPLYWDGQVVKLDIISSDFSYQNMFRLSGHSENLDMEATSRHADSQKQWPGGNGSGDAPPASPPNGAVLLNCYTEMDQDFTSEKSQPGWEHFSGGPNIPGGAGYVLSSNHPGESSRTRWHNPFVLKDKEAGFRITINMRGAPDAGRASYAILGEEACVEGVQKNCDEIDIVKIYGNIKAEAMWYGRSNGNVWNANDSATRLGMNGDALSYNASSPGQNHHTYTVYYEQTTGKIEFSVDGQIQISTVTLKYTLPMYLYLGIWDCTIGPGSCRDVFNGADYPGPVSFMDFAHVKIERCKP